MMTGLAERKQLLGFFTEAINAGARTGKAAAIIGLSLRTLQRWQQPETVQVDRRTLRQASPSHKLSEAERAKILAIANSEEFKDRPPHQIVPILAERGEYIASESSFYRVLRTAKQLTHRHAYREPNPRSKPKSLSATAPNQLYSWDITYLATQVKGQFFYLYLFMDIFSRKIVGWQVYHEESSQNAADLVLDICQREHIRREQLILHSDNGSPMKGATMLATLQKLGVVTSLSRPAVSNDNPYSESLFKTLKYCPKYPSQPFEDVAAARLWVAGFVQWYNFEHRHSSIQFATPAQRHNGEDRAILTQRQAVYEAARAKNPARWRNNTRNWEWQSEVFLNPDKPTEKVPISGSETVH
jgi:transposase InsO family protein